MPLNDTLSAVALKLGLKDTQLDALRRKRDQLTEAIRVNNDALEQLKEKSDKLDTQLSQRKREYDAAGSTRKLIVKEQLRALFAQQDGLMGKIMPISDRIRLDQKVRDKIDILIFAEENPSLTEQIDEMTLDMKEWLEEQKRQEKAKEDLEDIAYSSPQTDDSDFSDRLNKMSGDVETAGNVGADPLENRIAELG